MSVTPLTMRGRIVGGFVGFAVLVTLIFGLSASVFVYSVEDEFFNAVLREEAVRLEREHDRRGEWGTPQQRWMSVHASPATMPSDLRPQVESERSRREFSGEDGRHYHLRRLRTHEHGVAEPAAWLVAEVSDRLVVRPMRVALLWKWVTVELVILLMAVVLALNIARRIAHPLSALAERVRDLDPTRPSAPIAIAGADREVELVARAIDELRARVAALVEREQAFSRDASHELRTPLSVMRSTTAQALDDPALAPDSRRLLVLSLQSTEHMQRTVASLLSLTREKTGATDEVSSPVRPVLEAVIVEQAAALDMRDLWLDISVTRDARLRVPEVVLHLMLSNIIGNAVAHAADGPIRIQFAHQRLSVSNPVDHASLPGSNRLGEPGVKGDASQGSGLGLSILGRLCERAGLRLEWEAVDSVFRVSVSDTPPAELASAVSFPACLP